jgi:glutamate dehydrogenase/leucine dehydrogenase
LDEFEEPRFLEQVKLFFDRAASKTDIPSEYLQLIKSCNTVVRFNIPLRRDNGKVETLTCYRYFLIIINGYFLEPNTHITDFL